MSPPIALWNVVGETVNIFLETIVPLQCHFHTDIIFHGGEIEHFRVDRVFVFVQILNKRFDTAFVMEVVFFVITFVFQLD
ncbi:Uncharacterised protein [Yersinia enterocolitica]|nr:Uncharacterised protein [Yersinia enterocolitica]